MSPLTKSNNKGKVYLVGGGPGNQDLLTLQAKKVLQRAEVLIYDALIDSDLLNIVPEDCLKIDVGKRRGQESTPQTKINQLLVAYCHQGKQVVRLKSGDPFIFGRSRAEIEALTQANCAYRVIPGLSSALVAPLLEGIPLTDPLWSRHFVVVSGHQPTALDWSGLAKIDTLVILMGTHNLEVIINKLEGEGRSPSESIAIIQSCGTNKQKIWRGTLADIVEKTNSLSLSPAVIIIGQVIQHSVMSQSLPLMGKTILVTRAAEQASEFTNLLQHEGAKVIEMPTLEITPPSDWQDLDRAIASLDDFHWLILTSANAVEYFLQRLIKLTGDIRGLSRLKIAVVGKKTASSLTKYHLKPDFIPPNFIADSLVANFPERLSNLQILFPRVETGGREILVREFTKQGAMVTEVAAYQSQCPQNLDNIAKTALLNQEIDIITFASSKTVQNFSALIASLPLSSLDKVIIASIGPQTSQTCQQLFQRVDIEAQEYTLSGLTQAICDYTARNS